MKAKVLSILLMLLGCCALAQELPLRQAYNIDWEGHQVQTADAKDLVLWNDPVLGNNDIYIQRLDPAGQELWVTPLRIDAGSGEHRIQKVIETSEHHYFILWNTWNYPQHELLLQKFNSNGQFLWPEARTICSGTEEIPEIVMMANTTGGAFIIYNRQYNAYDIWGQNVDAEGINQWTAGGQQLAAFDEHIRVMDILSDNSGGFILNSRMEPENTSWTTHLIRFSATGTIIGANPLIMPGLFPSNIFSIFLCPDGYYLLSSQNSSGHVFYMQKMDPQGNLLGQISTYVMDDLETVKELVVSPKPNGGLLLAWRYWDQVIHRTKVQSFDSSLLPDWPVAEIPAFLTDIDYYNLTIKADPNGGAWLHYQNRIVHLNNQGQQTTNPEINLNPEHYCIKPTLSIYSNHALVYWKLTADQQMSLRKQLIHSNGILGLPEGGVAIVQHLDGNATDHKTIAFPNQFITFWNDCRDGWQQYRAYYQITTATGQTLLPTNGQPLIFGTSQVSSIAKVMKINDNSAAILYHGYNASQIGTWLQIIDSNGQATLPGEGIHIRDNLSFYYTYMGISDNDIYLGWQEELDDSSFQIVAQRIANGQKQWGEDGIVLLNPPQNGVVILTGVDGPHYFYTIQDYTTSTVTARALRTTPEGNVAPGWNTQGIDLLSGIDSDFQRTSYTTMQGEDLVAFIECDGFPLSVVRVQKINPYGEILWSPQGTAVYDLRPGDDISNVIVDQNISFLYQKSNFPHWLRYQKLNYDGQILLGQTGYLITNENFYEGEYCLVRFNDGYQAAAWIAPGDQFNSYGAFSDVMMSYLNTNGTPLGTPIVVCDAPYSQRYVTMSGMGDNALITWMDDRAGEDTDEYAYTSIYARMIQSYTAAVDPACPPVSGAILHQNYPNPFNPETTISFTLQNSGNVDLDIFNIKGQLVTSLYNDEALPSGTYSIVWDGRDEKGRATSSGIYFCRLKTGGQQIIKKMLMAK